MDTIRDKVILEERHVRNVSASDFPGAYPNRDGAWDFRAFRRSLRIEIVQMGSERDPLSLEFDLVGVDAAIANAIRRVVIGELPTMAVDRVFIHGNTSLIQDEFLAHRLGLIPVKADPRLFETRGSDDETTEFNTVELKLKVKCTRNVKQSGDPKDAYIHSNVYTSDMKWNPLGGQAERLRAGDVLPVDSDILIAKLRPGQELDIVAHCFKGCGNVHAKFSPVAIASYRLLPAIRLLAPVRGDLAQRLADCFTKDPRGDVIKVARGDDGEVTATVANPRRDSGCREVHRHPELSPLVELSRIRNHFIFTVESTGALPPHELVIESLDILINKCDVFLGEIAKIAKRS